MKRSPYSGLLIIDNYILSLCNNDSVISSAVFAWNFLIVHSSNVLLWNCRVFSLIVGYLLSIFLFMFIFVIKTCSFLMIWLVVMSGIQDVNSHFFLHSRYLKKLAKFQWKNENFVFTIFFISFCVRNNRYDTKLLASFISFFWG